MEVYIVTNVWLDLFLYIWVNDVFVCLCVESLCCDVICDVIFVRSFLWCHFGCERWSWKLKRRLLWGFWYLARDPKLWRWLEVAEAVLKLSVDTELPTLSSKWFQAAIIRGQRGLLIVLWYTLGTTVWNLQRNDWLADWTFLYQFGGYGREMKPGKNTVCTFLLLLLLLQDPMAIPVQGENLQNLGGALGYWRARVHLN